ncbi:serine/threonine-protein kinase 4 [Cocos nucifera]|uniref:Serine/threonine-protein kinase 4 n=1 Tax=Cocos nucifera TaxID=13894 RepID=A0A8K0IPW5_COCNU|nr:serine/threonine-protein kinase 4 [Cocos nucifera]
MILIDHPNVLKAHCSFVNGHDLWIVMPYMAGGSCLHIMKSAYPNGFEEIMIATILREVLKGLDYLHHHGHIHRDVKSFKQMIALCLVKDPSRRPSAKKLLKQPFFKQARSQDYIVRKILEGLPTLGVRHQALKDKEEDLVAQKKMPDGKKEEISQNEYKKGISSWNFDIEDLKAQASLIPDEDTVLGKDLDRCQGYLFKLDTLQDKMPEGTNFFTSCSLKYDDDIESNGMAHDKSSLLSSSDQTTYLQRARSNEAESESGAAGKSDQNVLQNGLQFHGNGVEHCSSGSYESDNNVKHVDNVPIQTRHEQKSSTSSCSSDILPSAKGESHQLSVFESTKSTPELGKLQWRVFSHVSSADDLDDKSKPLIVQQRGRFKVTSENVDLDKALPPIILQKSHSFQVIPQLLMTTAPSSVDATSNLSACSIFPQLHSILQANILERDNILSMMKQLSTGDSPISDASSNHSTEGASLPSPKIVTEKSLLELAHEREKELIQDITDLQWRRSYEGLKQGMLRKASSRIAKQKQMLYQPKKVLDDMKVIKSKSQCIEKLYLRVRAAQWQGAIACSGSLNAYDL